MWLIIAAVLLIIELLTGMVATLCMGTGCLLGVLAALVGMSLEVQLGAVAVGVILSFMFIAPLANRMRRRRRASREEYNSNMDALIGRETTVRTPIMGPASPGRVNIDGDSWQARSSDGSPIDSGTTVRITGYDSIILIVKPVTKQ